MYRQERLTESRLKVKVIRLFGRHDDTVEHLTNVGFVTLKFHDSISKKTIITASTNVSLDGNWNQKLDLKIPISEIMTKQHVISVFYNDTPLSEHITLFDPLDDRFMRRGLVKVQIAGPPSSEQVALLDKQVISRVQSGTWPTVDWLDQLTFDKIADIQLEEAMTRGQLFLVLEVMPNLEGRVLIRDDLVDLANIKHSIDPLDMPAITPHHLPTPPPHLIIRPSPRSAPLLHRLQRLGLATMQLPPFAPSMLWKYRKWITQVNDNPRLLLLFIRSVDWLDREELEMAKELVVGFKTDQRFALCVSLMAMMLHHDKRVFDDSLCDLLKRSNGYCDDLMVYVMCMFVKNITIEQCPLLVKYIRTILGQATKESLYAAMAVYWLLEREDWIENDSWREMMGKQRMLIDNLQSLIDTVRADQDSGRGQKRDRLMSMLKDPPDHCPPLLVPFLSVALPTEPHVIISGVIPDHTSVYKSTQMPVKMAFLSDPDCQSHSVIIKTGEKVDGDLMVMQVIRVIDRLWQDYGLNLHIQTYSILPTPHQHGGWLQFVPSSSLSAILRDNHNSLLPYLNTAPEGADQRYIRSCAGYCLITFVLGVGDRHLENLLLTTDGRLFHVDYAFMFGADPKPFPPPMKLCKEMVQAMGQGVGSKEFIGFKELCLQAYQIVRLHGGLLLDLLSLHSDLVGETELAFVKDRLALEKSDVVALTDMSKLIDESVNAMFPQVMETLHKWAQYWRA